MVRTVVNYLTEARHKYLQLTAKPQRSPVFLVSISILNVHLLCGCRFTLMSKQKISQTKILNSAVISIFLNFVSTP